MRRPVYPFSCLLRSETGTAAIEFSLVVPIFLFITFFLVELCIIGFSAVSIENSVISTMRLAKVGAATGGLSKDAFIRQQIRERAYGLIDPQRLAISVQVLSPSSTPPAPQSLYPEERCQAPDGSFTGAICNASTGCGGTPPIPFDDANGNGVCNPDPPPVDVGQPGDIVVYSVAYRYRQMTPFVPFSSLFGGVALGEGARNEVVLVSSGATRIEP